MADGDFRSLLKRGLERLPTPPDFNLEASRRTVGTEPKAFESPAIIEHDMQTRRRAELKTEQTPYLRIQQHQTPTPLDHIAALLQSLTYGEMIELSQAIWKSRSEVAVTGETLPPVLHRWSANHLAAAQNSREMF
jgi:hypothetical protein